MTTTQITLQERFNNAKKEIRQTEIRVKQNVMTCCRSCAGEEALGIKCEDEKLIWHFGGQGHAFGWDCGEPVNRTVLQRGYSRSWKGESDIEYSIYFNHNNLTWADIESVIAIFAKHDIIATCENESQCIEVQFQQTIDRDNAKKAAQAVNNDTYAMC